MRTHTCVLQNAGVRGRSFRLTGLTYVSVFECASPVLQEQAQSCFRRRIRCITIAGAVHLCLRKHTCVLQKQRVRGHASACGDVFIERAQVPVSCTMYVPLGVVGGRCVHMISRTHLCCGPFVPIYPAIWSHSTCLRTHMCLQKAGLRGRSFRLRGLRMFLRLRQCMFCKHTHTHLFVSKAKSSWSCLGLQ